MAANQFGNPGVGGLAARNPQVQAAAEHHDGEQVEQGPEDLQWRAAIVAEVQGTRHFQRRQVPRRSEEHTSELQSLMRISYAVFCLKKKNKSKKSITQSND